MSASGVARQRLWTVDFLFLIAIQTVGLFTYNMVTPVIARYATTRGATLVLAGFIASAFMFIAVFARPLSGFLADRMGRRRIIGTAIVIDCLALVGYAFAPGFGTLIALRVAHGFFYALFGTAVATMAISTIPFSRRGEGMSWFSLSYVFAGALGPALGVFLSDHFGYVPMFLVGAAVALASLPLLFRVKAAAPSDSPSSFRPTGIGDFISLKCLPLAAVICVFAIIWGVIATFIVLIGDDRGIVGISLFFTVNALTLLISRPLAGRRADARGLSAVYYPSAIIEAAAVLLIAFSNQLWLILVSAACKALGSGTAWPSIQGRCGQLETPGRSGVAMSTFLLGTDVGYAIGPALGGAIAHAYGYTTMLLACLPILAVGVAVYAVWARRTSLAEGHEA